VAIVSENLARELWGAPAAALGKRVRQFYGTPGPWQEVIGVAGDVHDDGVHVPAPATVYWPARLDDDVFAGYQPRRISVMIRSARAGTASFADEVRRAVRDVDRALPVADLQTLEPLYAGAMSRTSFTLALMAAAAAVALVLGVSGLYGVVAYAVAQRRREIGIRLALGAADRQIRGLFVRHGLLVIAAGLGGGLAGAAAAARVMASLLFGVAPTDLLTFVAAPLVLGTTAVLATYLPARRAMRVDPVETMKAE
jgi:putative ABC transport system permease protein